MSMSQYCVSWDSYKNNIAKGFCQLQQNSEFVDMTLAAEGHFVKVHQNIVALASPYLKQILQSAPCQHPIIFLSNISHKVLGYLLEYIYNGEVMIPKDEVDIFIEASKVLHITGVENFILPENIPSNPKEYLFDNIPKATDNYAAHITINAQNYNLEVNPIENNYNHDNLVPAAIGDFNEVMDTLSYPIETDKVYDITPIIVDNIIINENNICNVPNGSLNTNNDPVPKKSENKIQKKKFKPPGIGITLTPDKCKDSIPQYSISNRGAAQLLFNRYLYHCHHHSHEGRKRRWRCIDYRKIRCPATIDTDGETILNRSEVHTHPNHDNKILKKFKHKTVFTSLSIAEEKTNELASKEKYNSNEEEQDILISQLS